MFNNLRMCPHCWGTVFHSSPTILHSNKQCPKFQFLHSHIYFRFFFFDNIYFNGCEMVCYCGFDLHFPKASDIEVILSLAYWPFVYLCSRNFNLSPSLIFYLCLQLLSCNSSVYILGYNLLSDIWFTNNFSHAVGDL